MEITRTITKTGLKAQGGLTIPSPFYYKGETSGITFAHSGVGFTGGFFISLEATTPIILEGGLSQHPRGGVSANVGGLAKDVCTCSEDELTHTIDSSKLMDEVDALIVSKFETLELADIS